MFLKTHARKKDGKTHRYYSLVESMRTARGPQHRTLAYLGELNGSTEEAWRKTIAVFNGAGNECQLELFSSDAPELPSGERVAQVVLDRVRWERPRQFGQVFLAHHLWRLLGLDELLSERMEEGAEEVPWGLMVFILTAARLIAPTSELGIEQRFYPTTALEDITGVDQPIAIDWNTVIFNSLTLKGVYGREMYETWYKMTVMVQSGLDITPVITHRFAAEDYEKGFSALRAGEASKVVLTWAED